MVSKLPASLLFPYLERKIESRVLPHVLYLAYPKAASVDLGVASMAWWHLSRRSVTGYPFCKRVYSGKPTVVRPTCGHPPVSPNQSDYSAPVGPYRGSKKHRL